MSALKSTKAELRRRSTATSEIMLVLNEVETSSPPNAIYPHTMSTQISLCRFVARLGVVSSRFSPWVFVPANSSGVCVRWGIFHPACKEAKFAVSVPSPKPEIIWLESGNEWENICKETPVDVLIYKDKCRPSRPSANVWKTSATSLQLIISSRSLRGGNPVGWTHSARAFSRRALGGATDWFEHIHVWQRNRSFCRQTTTCSEFFVDNFCRGVPCMLASLIDKSVGEKTALRPQGDGFDCERDPFPVVALRAQGRESRKYKFPTIYGKDSFCERKFTGLEMCLLWDVPVTISRRWTEAMKVLLSRHLAAPVKVVASIGRCIQQTLRHIRSGDKCALSNDNGESTEPGTNPCVKRRRTVDLEKGSGGSGENFPRNSACNSRMQGYVPTRDMENMATESAVKNDKAEVPTYLWNDRLHYLLGVLELEAQHLRAFDLLRRCMLRRWKAGVYRSWRRWWSKNCNTININYPQWTQLIMKRGDLACLHARDATFWSWDRGSAIFFWRWPEEFMIDVAVGVVPLWRSQPAQRIEEQSRLGDAATVAKIVAKLQDVQVKGYIEGAPCVAMMNYFAVPKGDDDVRMVYDGTKSGLNACLYALWFILPDASVLTCTLDDKYWCIDNDYGEMFLNFWIHPELMAYSGMDLTPLFGRREDGQLWLEVWLRCPMGQRPSPYAMIQQTQRLKRIIMGDQHDSKNVFRWDNMHLNLPGTTGYLPGEPWISKRRKEGHIAADAHDYVDNLRGTAPTQEDAWQVGAAIAKTASFLGVQDTCRKRRAQTQRPWAWAGVVCGTTPSRPYITMTQTKWDCTKAEIARLRGLINQATMRNGQHQIEHKPLEQVAGFLNHIARAFPTIKIYLNGVYATMNSWRPDRDEEDWRIGNFKIECKSQTPQAPKRVRLVKRMIFDVAALESLTESPVPPECVLRPSKHGSRARYIFADASGAGLGSTDWSPGDDQIQVDYGTWGPEISTGTSSNFRELSNIVLKIEKLDQSGALTELTEVFVFTNKYITRSLPSTEAPQNPPRCSA
ncbi:hypothetical protein ACA910_016514 [Epithemia clementina (nom. ined.)]